MCDQKNVCNISSQKIPCYNNGTCLFNETGGEEFCKNCFLK